MNPNANPNPRRIRSTRKVIGYRKAANIVGNKSKRFLQPSNFLNALIKTSWCPPYMENDQQDNMVTKTKRTAYGEIEEILDEAERKYNSFKNFDVNTYPPADHYFLNCRNYGQKKFLSTILSDTSSLCPGITREWRFLEKNTPDSVFIRAYLEKKDLMRAAVTGPPGSHYEHCLFFFDILYPWNYPASPPKLHYHSYGLELNQNLRLGGGICLDLLETWRNHRDKNLNLLDVLSAIQSMMILEPIYHTPKSSCFPLLVKLEELKTCNKKVFQLKCDNIIRTLKDPPVDFRDLVVGHFRRMSHLLLLNFKEYQYHDCQYMIGLFVTMFKAFERNGSYCKHHFDFLRSAKQHHTNLGIEAIIRDLEEHQKVEEEHTQQREQGKYGTWWEEGKYDNLISRSAEHLSSLLLFQ